MTLNDPEQVLKVTELYVNLFYRLYESLLLICLMLVVHRRS